MFRQPFHSLFPFEPKVRMISIFFVVNVVPPPKKKKIFGVLIFRRKKKLSLVQTKFYFFELF